MLIVKLLKAMLMCLVLLSLHFTEASASEGIVSIPCVQWTFLIGETFFGSFVSVRFKRSCIIIA